VTSFKTSPILI